MTYPGQEQPRLLWACIAGSMLLHALLMWQAHGVRSSPAPDTQIRASIRPAPPPPPAAPAVAPEPPRPEPPKPEVKPEPAPPIPQARPEPQRPVPERTVPLRPEPKAAAPDSKAAAAPPQPAPAPPSAPAPEGKSDAKTETAKAPATAPPAAPGPAASDDDLRAVVGSYETQLAQQTEKRLRYPAPALDQRWEGVANVRVSVDEKGYIKSVELLKSSGYELLDEQAKIAVQKAKPFVQIPPPLRGKAFLASVAVVFNVKNQGQ